MRWNTVNKRKSYREAMIRQLRRQGYMFNNSAEIVVDKWINGGTSSITSDVVKESIRLAKLNVVWEKKVGIYGIIGYKKRTENRR